MTTIAETLNDIALQASVDTPDSWVSATDQDAVEIRDVYLRQTVDDILARADLPAPIGKQYTLTGDGSEEYNLPSDFLRMKRGTFAAYETGLLYPMTPVGDAGEFEYIKDRGIAGADRYYMIEGYDGAFTIKIYRAPSASVSLLLSYVSKLWKASSAGTAGSTFTADDDILLLPRDLVEAGTLMRLRRRRGLAYEDVQADYEARMSRYASDSTGRRSLNFGSQAPRKPWDVPVPDFIPSS